MEMCRCRGDNALPDHRSSVRESFSHQYFGSRHMNTLSTGSILRRSVLTLLTGAALSIGYAHAETNELRQVRVQYSELDLSREAGASALYRRLERAAAKVCEERPWMRSKQIDKECYQRALTSAVVEINSPLVSQIHGMQTERLAAKK
jgi:UrcA family protein